MSHLVLINGKPRSGKDAVGDVIAHNFGAKRVKMTAPIDLAFKSLFGLEEWQFLMLREEFKEAPLPIGDIDHGVSLRDFYIRFSEEFLKPLLGDGIFGHLAARSVVDFLKDGNVVVTDCGFNRELLALLEEVGDDFNVWGITVDRDGCKWDSREPIDFWSFEIPSVAIENNGSLGDLESIVVELCQEHFGIEPKTLQSLRNN